MRNNEIEVLASELPILDDKQNQLQDMETQQKNLTIGLHI